MNQKGCEAVTIAVTSWHLPEGNDENSDKPHLSTTGF
jgi:hypothetical protein